MNVRNEVRSHLVCEGVTMQDVLKKLEQQYGWSRSISNLSGKLHRETLRYKEALNHPFDEPKQWEIREINDIMNNSIVGWKQFTNPRHFAGYGRQKGWERDNQPVATGTNSLEGFVELTEEEAKQMELPFGNTG